MGWEWCSRGRAGRWGRWYTGTLREGGRQAWHDGDGGRGRDVLVCLGYLMDEWRMIGIVYKCILLIRDSGAEGENEVGVRNEGNLSLGYHGGV